MKQETMNLFIYGSLRDPMILKSVCGLSFSLNPAEKEDEVLFAELALLPGYKRVSPDNVYFYGVKDDNAKIEGMVLYDVPVSAMDEIDKYEGQFYDRENVHVNTANGPVFAKAYLVSTKSMRKHFGDRYHVNLIHELWLRKRIEQFLDRHTRPGEDSLDADVERKARRELLGVTERDLVISHLRSEAVSDYYLEHELDRPNPSILHLYDDQEANSFLGNYLMLVVKQVILNQLEQMIQSKYRYELDRLNISERYYTRIISLLASLRMMNSNSSSVRLILEQCLENMQPGRKDYDLIDYVKYAVQAAFSMFDSRVVKSEFDRIRANRQQGLMPLGAELELSNVGYRAIHEGDMTSRDYVFAGFKYFNDFALDILMWKLGGYIDDHGLSKNTRSRGFLELAPGRLNVKGELSKPATSDPWVLNQLIHEITEFYPVRPHSLHLTFQMNKRQLGNQRMLTLGLVKCLLALGGGTQSNPTGGLWVSRMGHDEIQQNIYGQELIFARTAKRKSRMMTDDIKGAVPAYATKQTMQYKFIRLERRANYEPLIMALKGLQVSYNPADYLTADQLNSSYRLRREYEELKEWAQEPTEIAPQIRARFLSLIYDGLMHEAHQGPAQQLHYIDWAMGAIDVQLRLFNKQIQKASSDDNVPRQ